MKNPSLPSWYPKRTPLPGCSDCESNVTIALRPVVTTNATSMMSWRYSAITLASSCRSPLKILTTSFLPIAMSSAWNEFKFTKLTLDQWPAVHFTNNSMHYIKYNLIRYVFQKSHQGNYRYSYGSISFCLNEPKQLQIPVQTSNWIIGWEKRLEYIYRFQFSTSVG